MAFTSRDGSQHTNHASMRQADSRQMAKTPAPAPEAEPEGDPMEEGGDGAAMAQEHGPAVEVNVSHDHQGGRHSVHAVHPDGHSHETEHASADEAHKYAGDCAGCM